jgi:hypothetical protein
MTSEHEAKPTPEKTSAPLQTWTLKIVFEGATTLPVAGIFRFQVRGDYADALQKKVLSRRTVRERFGYIDMWKAIATLQDALERARVPVESAAAQIGGKWYPMEGYFSAAPPIADVGSKREIQR